jgi:hypothetical protein
VAAPAGVPEQRCLSLQIIYNLLFDMFLAAAQRFISTTDALNKDNGMHL